MSSKKIENGITELLQPIQPPTQLFADSMNVLVGVPISKIQIYSVVGQDEKSGNELRQVTSHVIISTGTLIEFCKNTLNALAENEEKLNSALEIFNNQMHSAASKKLKG